ncbi:MAG: rhodanese-like domain-containing protein [Armatimonadetes bacterium]|nr:rhodanese-like domain-containing protein [Armatimonadota bacterium]
MMNKTIDVQELRAMIQSQEPLQLIDVRSPGEFSAGHVPQAINIPLEQVEARLGDFTSGKVALLCQSGRRAGLACDVLQDHHQNLVVVEGGTKAWMDKGYPTVASNSTRWSLERQVRLGAGLLVLIGTVLALLASPAWIYLAMFVGAGLTFAGLTNICGMAMVLAKLPWNRPSRSQTSLKQEISKS